jgi:hypothetical protein
MPGTVPYEAVNDGPWPVPSLVADHLTFSGAFEITV